MLHIIGVGGNATVYEAEDLVEHRLVAIKTPQPRADSSAAVERFFREVRLGEKLSHPNIAAVLGSGTLQNGQPFLVLERMLGETLESRITRLRRIPLASALGIAMHVLRALDWVHALGVLHRDVKPKNVFLAQPRDTAKLLDFGSSKSIDYNEDSQDLTRVGFAVGTPFYMSPEQAAGGRDADERSDVYATGILLYEALSGRKPYRGRTVKEVFARIAAGGARPPSHYNASVSPELDAVVLRAISVSRSERFSSARKFAEALESVGAVVPPDDDGRDGKPIDYLRQRLHEISVMHRERQLKPARSSTTSAAGAGTVALATASAVERGGASTAGSTSSTSSPVSPLPTLGESEESTDSATQVAQRPRTARPI